MQVSHEIQADGVIQVQVTGEMDAIGCGKTRSSFEEIVAASNEQAVALDLGGVTFLDSSGIGAIVFLFKRLKAKGSDLVIQGAEGQPRELLQLLRFDQAIRVEWSQMADQKTAS